MQALAADRCRRQVQHSDRLTGGGSRESNSHGNPPPDISPKKKETVVHPHPPGLIDEDVPNEDDDDLIVSSTLNEKEDDGNIGNVSVTDASISMLTSHSTHRQTQSAHPTTDIIITIRGGESPSSTNIV